MKNKDKIARTTLESHYARKYGREKAPHIPKMTQFLKGGKKGHFAKAIYSKAKWSVVVYFGSEL